MRTRTSSAIGASSALVLLVLCLALCCVVVVVDGATVQVFKDADCTTDSGAGVISLVPVNQCEVVASGDSGSLRLTCVSGQLTYEQWQAKSNTECAGTADIVASSTVNSPATCIPMTLNGQPTPGAIRIDCNAAAHKAASAIILALLAFVATRAAQAA